MVLDNTGRLGGASLDLDHCSSEYIDIVLALEPFWGHMRYSYHKTERGNKLVCTYMFMYF